MKSSRKRTATRRPRKPAAASERLAELVVDTLGDLKAQSIKCLDVRHLTSVTDIMVIATGRSDRHVRALSESLLERCEEAGYRALGVEGREAAEWVLVDLADVVVHLMLPRVREFYSIENLWDMEDRDNALEERAT